MSNFTVTPPVKTTLITLEEDSQGQVDILAHGPNSLSCRLASFGAGKLYLFRQSKMNADMLGLSLDSNGYPLLCHV